MSASNMIAAYLGAIIGLLLVMYFINRTIRKYLSFVPDETEDTGEGFVLDLPHYSYWKYELTKAIEIIDGSMAKTELKLKKLQKLPHVELNFWDKMCEKCARVGSKLWVYVLIVADIVLVVWLMFASVSVVGLVKSHPDFFMNPTPLPEIILPTMQDNLYLAALITGIGAVLLLVEGVVGVLARVSSPRIKAHRVYTRAKKVEIPLLKGQISWLKGWRPEKIER